MPILLDGDGSIGGVSGLGGGNFQATSLETTSGGLLVHEVSSNRYTLRVDATNNTVGINTSSAPTAGTFLQIADTTDPIVSLNNTTGSGEVRLGCTATAGYIGTESNHPFNIEINSATAVTVLANGNIGIGGTLPASPNISLNADGSAEFAADVTINGVTVGRGAGNVNTNTAIGNSALDTNTTGTQNTAVGYEALNANTIENGNTAVGYEALTSSITGGVNTAVGNQALSSNTTGSENTAVGHQALTNIRGSNNTAVGRQAGFWLENGSNNTILGCYLTTPAEASLSDTVIISAGQTQRMRINSSGDTTFYGNVSTPGVVFGTPSGNAISKTLDDYEEGTFTPVVGYSSSSVLPNITDTRKNGSYVKIGQTVWFSLDIACTIDWSAMATINSALSILGLPFVSEQTTSPVVGSAFQIGVFVPRHWTTDWPTYESPSDEAPRWTLSNNASSLNNHITRNGNTDYSYTVEDWRNAGTNTARTFEIQLWGVYTTTQ